jgi:hypothetical protein
VRSTNNGTSWTNIGGGLPYSNIRALANVASYPFNILAGMISGRISQSSNYGANWIAFPDVSEQPPGLAYVNSILKIDTSSYFWVGTDLGVYLLPQFYPLSSWIPYSTGLASGEFTKVRALVYANGAIFAGTDNGVYVLNGTTWVQKNSGLTNTNITALKSVDGYLIAGTSQGSVGGIYISSDTAKTWTLSNSDAWITSILTIGSNIFVGSYGNGVWLSTNYGTTWNQVNTGLGSGAYNVLSLGANTQFLFAGTVSSSIWRRPLSQMITVPTAVHETGIQIKTFSLEQNYPNPFNPSTNISFSIPKQSTVTLKVYDLLGKEVATLVNNEIVAAGNYAKQWNAANLTSGVYFYRLQAGSFTQTKRLVLLK